MTDRYQTFTRTPLGKTLVKNLGLPDPLPLSVVLADHRAGDDSLFLYPWC